MAQWYNALVKDSKSDSDGVDLEHIESWIDVRDLAEAHVRSLEKEEAGGERIIVSGGTCIRASMILVMFIELICLLSNFAPGLFNWKIWLDAKNGKRVIPIDNAKANIVYDLSKSDKVLGIKYRGVEETEKDILKSFKERGWA